MSNVNEKETKPQWSMTRGGAYSLATQGAKDAIDNCADLALAALAAIDVEHGTGSFNFADYAAADGGTSLELMGTLVSEVRRRAPGRPICIYYTDLPRNDFSALFANVQGPGAYLQNSEGVHVFASATSFYEAIFPPAFIDFGFSATAMHWISAIPGPLTDCVHASRAQGEEFEAFRKQAVSDWEAILFRRAGELKPGGRLVMTNLCNDEQGRNLGNHRSVCMHDMFQTLWAGLRQAGVIEQDEYERLAFPQFYKTLDEFCEPLRDPANRVHQAGLRLEQAQTRVVPCPYRERYEQDGDLDTFAESFVPTTRSWSETIFFNSLNPSRGEAERHAIVERLFSEYVSAVKAAPDGHAMDYAHCYQVLVKDESAAG